MTPSSPAVPLPPLVPIPVVQALQVLTVLVAAPGINGVIARVEARLQGRRGPRVTMNVSIAIPAAVDAGKTETPITTQATKTIADIDTNTNRTAPITDPLIRSTDLGTVSEQRRDLR